MAAVRQKVERSGLGARTCRRARAGCARRRRRRRWPNAERELVRPRPRSTTCGRCCAEGFITQQELERAEQAVERARRRSSRWRSGGATRWSSSAGRWSCRRPGRRRILDPGERAPAEVGRAYRLEQKKSGDRAPPRAASRRRPASWRWPSSSSRAPRCGRTCPASSSTATSSSAPSSGKPQVGDQVWANQPLLILPDISKMVVETKVRETDIHKIEQNQKVSVRVQAYPDLTLTGQVTLVGTLAQEEKERRGRSTSASPSSSTESEPRLRPGMSARVEIQVEEKARAALRAAGGGVREGRPARCATSAAGPPARAPGGPRPANRDFAVVARAREGRARGPARPRRAAVRLRRGGSAS